MKRYIRLNFQNSPSTATPLNAVNLNKMDKGIDDCDNAIEDLYSVKFDKASIANNLITTASGLALDARQGKVLQDQITAQNDNLALKILPTYGNTLTGGTDFNNLKVAAIYDYQANLSYINAPANGEYGILEVVKLNIFILQRATNVVANTVKHRSSYDNGVSWTAWA
jgi:hypothetical protein